MDSDAYILYACVYPFIIYNLIFEHERNKILDGQCHQWKVYTSLESVYSKTIIIQDLTFFVTSDCEGMAYPPQQVQL